MHRTDKYSEHSWAMFKISIIFHKFYQFWKYLYAFLKNIMLNLSKIMPTTVYFDKISPEMNRQAAIHTGSL